MDKRLPPEVSEALENPHCGCWDKCKCGGGDKAVVLAKALRTSLEAQERAESNLVTAESVALVEKMKAESQVASLTAHLAEYHADARKCCGEEMERRLEAAQKECEEQARLNGMGASREAALLARAEQAEAELAALYPDDGRWKELFAKQKEITEQVAGRLAEVERESQSWERQCEDARDLALKADAKLTTTRAALEAAREAVDAFYALDSEDIGIGLKWKKAGEIVERLADVLSPVAMPPNASASCFDCACKKHFGVCVECGCKRGTPSPSPSVPDSVLRGLEDSLAGRVVKKERKAPEPEAGAKECDDKDCPSPWHRSTPPKDAEAVKHEDWCLEVQPIHEDGPCNCKPRPQEGAR